MKPLRFLSWRPSSRLFRALWADPFLLTLTVILTLAAWAPLLASPFLPFSDLHNNAGAASMLFEAATHRGTIGHHYQVNWTPIPYWTGYVVMAAASAVGGTLFAAKAMVALLAVLLPLSVMRLLLSVGRSPRLGLWAFAGFWDHNLYAGWVTYLLGMGIALLVLAWLIDMETPWDALCILPWTVIVALTHAQSLALLVVAGPALMLTRRPTVRRVLLHTLALSGGLVFILPWLGANLVSKGKSTLGGFSFDWHTPAAKATQLFAYTLDNYTKEPVVYASAFAFMVLLVGPVLLSAVVRSERPLDRARDHGAAAVVMLSVLFLYVALPFEIRGSLSHWHNYPRYATFILLTMLLLPRPDSLRGRRALALLPGIVAALSMDVAARQLQRFAVNSRPFLDIIAAVPRGSRVLPLINTDYDATCAYTPYNQFHAYLTGATHSYNPYLFDTTSNPLLYRPETRPVVPRWARATYELSLEKHGGAFDFILVQGLDRDPFPKGERLQKARVHRVAEGGIWRLYAIDKDL